MPKLIFTINEKVEHIGEQTLVGFQISQGFEYTEEDDPRDSMLPALALVLPMVVNDAICTMQKNTGGFLHKCGPTDNPITIENVMEDFKKKLEAESSFPPEIEVEGQP